MDWIILVLLIIIALSNGLYHVFEKKLGKVKNPFFALVNTYLVIIVGLTILVLILGISFDEIVAAINWPIVLVAISCIGFNFFIILTYKYGAKVATLFDIITPIAAISVIVIGILVFNEEFTLLNAIGLVISLIGVYLISSAEEDEDE